MANLVDPAVLEDPVEINHPELEEEPDWRDRGSSSELSTRLWYGGGGDFGAMTRFGLGWGPLELRRSRRYDLPGTDVRRVVDLVVAGEPRLSIFVTGEGRQIRVFDVQTSNELVANGTGVAAPYHEARQDVIRGRDVEHLPLIDEPDPESPRDLDDAALATFIERLKELNLTVQEYLTDERRQKRYLPRAAMDAIDQMTTLIGEFTNEELVP